jgi:hypothetical protein
MFLEASEIRQKFNIVSNGFSNQIDAALLSAALLIREAIEADIYAEAGGVALESTDDNYLRQQKVVQSHAYLTYYFLLEDAGNKFAADGIIKEAQDSASVEGGRVITNKYLTPAEINEMKANALAKSNFFLSPYGVITVADGIITEVAQDTLTTTLAWF